MKNQVGHSMEAKYRSVFITCIVVSLLFPAGIVMTVLGAVNTVYGVMIPGIVFTAFSFYATPMVWVFSFPKARRKRAVRRSIGDRDEVESEEISRTIGYRLESVKRILHSLIEGGFLPGYALSPGKTSVYRLDRITYKDGKKVEPAPAVKSARCPNCGASLSLCGICTYCQG